MMLTASDKHMITGAIEDATLLGLDLDVSGRRAGTTLAVWNVQEVGGWPDDPRILFIFSGVARIAASLRNGAWNDADAAVAPIGVDELPKVIASFGGSEIYGASFFDRHEEARAAWGDRLSLDLRCGSQVAAHSITLFQEEAFDRFLEFCVWFEELALVAPSGSSIEVADLIEGYERWSKARGWEAAMQTGAARRLGALKLPN
jgi:hypothetical protein